MNGISCNAMSCRVIRQALAEGESLDNFLCLLTCSPAYAFLACELNIP